MTCERHPWGEASGLVCTGSGEGHTHVYASSAGPDLDDEAHHADQEQA